MKSWLGIATATVLTASALAACATDEAAGNQVARKGRIEFTASVATASTRSTASASLEPMKVSGYSQDLWLLPTVTPTTAVTRGTLLDSNGEMTSFGVSAYKHGKSVDITDAKPDYFYNLKATKPEGGTSYQIGQDYYWPSGEERLTFYAYYPYNSGQGLETDSSQVALSASSQTGRQKVTFTVSDEAARQTDFMTATATNQTPSTAATPSVSLQFHHQLAAVRFVIGEQFATKGYIQKIWLKNVYKRGVYTIGAEAATAWTHGDSDRGTFSVSYTADEKINGTVGQTVTREGETFLMIPTAFASDDEAEIQIDFWGGDRKYELKSPLKDVSWEAGKTYTYTISSETATTLKIKDITFAETPTGAPRTAWQDGDQVGLYVVHGVKKASDDESVTAGRTLRYSNVACTYNGSTGKWSVAQVGGKSVIMYPGDSYYFYYPYQSSPSGYPNECNEVGASAQTFFSSVITAHTVETDQSKIADFVSSDLQVAKAVTPEEDNDLAASTISASMDRKVGLAVISLGSATANKTKVFTNNDAGTVTETASVTASSTFSGNTPYNNSTAYYAYVKAGNATTFSSATYSDTNKDAWEASLVFNIAAGASETKTAYSNRKNWEYVNAVWNYSYTANNCYTWTPAPQGTNGYVMECWGAQGGGGRSQAKLTDAGGKGAYVKGTINLQTNQTLFVYVGGKGGDAAVRQSVAGGYNGGGTGDHDHSDDEAAGGGGGATDIRTADGAWNNFASLKTRIMVAAGGGGGETTNEAKTLGGPGAAISGGAPSKNGKSLASYGTLSSQIGGYQFGIGQDGVFISDNHPRGGGGGGWYGGVVTRDNELDGFYASLGFGGSSFISGHSGCRAIKQSATVNTGGESNHESGSVVVIGNTSYEFSFTQMIAGDATQTKPGGGTETGHSGNGYARITLTRW